MTYWLPLVDEFNNQIKDVNQFDCTLSIRLNLDYFITNCESMIKVYGKIMLNVTFI